MKTRYIKIWSVLVGTFYCQLIAFSQTPDSLTVHEGRSWILDDSTMTGTHTYIALDSIVLKPGFSYEATNGNVFTGEIYQLSPPTWDGDTNPINPSLPNNPPQEGVVGTIPGQFAVSPSGAATYSIPIECPPGINGMQPNISLAYNSQGGNGIAGWGWNLSGLSAITKGAKTIFSDDAVSGIDLSAKSDYYLDGNKLFVKTGFTYGATNAEYETESRTYVHIKQTASANNYPSKFTVTDKNGTVMEYGEIVKPKNSSYPFQWLLSKVTDANGNFVKYTYKTNTNATQTVLDYVEYGSNGTTVAPLKMEFDYGTKSHIQRQWLSGYYVEDYHLLQNITIKSNQTQLRNYQLTYDYQDEKHFPTSIKLTNETGESLPATTISWGEPNKSMYTQSQPALINISTPSKIAFFSDDITGDGVSDLITMTPNGHHTHVNVYKASGSRDCSFTQYGSTSDFPVSFSDKYGSQKAGNFMVLRHYDKKWISMLVSNSNNTSFWLYDPSNTNNKTNIRCMLVANRQLSILHTIADFNNDGNDEILYVNPTGSIISIFTGAMLYPGEYLPDVTSEDVFNSWLDNIFDKPLNIFSSDFDVDGLIDVAITGKNGIYIYKNNGGTKQDDGIVHVGFSLAGTTALDMSNGWHVIKPGDFNGDGLMDFISYDGKNDFRLLLNNGHFGFDISSLPDITMKEETSTTNNDAKDDFIVIDFNLDGKSDLIVIDAKYNNKGSYTDTDIKRYISTGTTLQFDNYYNLVNEDYYYKGYATTGDFNGDGREDLFSLNAKLDSYSSATQKQYVCTAFNTNFSANLVRDIKNGMDVWQNIGYQSLTYSDNFYTKRESFFSEKRDYHITDIQAPLYCVKYSSIMWWDDKVGWLNAADNSYSYVDLKAHTQGKGLLGFKEIAIVNATAATSTYNGTVYDYVYCVPLQQTQSVFAIGYGHISWSYNFFKTTKSGKIITTMLDSVSEIDYLSGLSKGIKYRYDNFGNLTQMRTKQGNLVETQTMNYVQRGSWCLNKPDNVTLTKEYNGDTYTRTSAYEYNEQGVVTKETTDPNDANKKVVTEYDNFTTFGQPQTIKVTANGQTRTSSVTYLSGRFVNTKINHLDEKTTYNWNEAKGVLNSEVDHWNRKTSYRYDSWGRRTNTTYPDGFKSTTALQWVGKKIVNVTAKYSAYSQNLGEAPVTVLYDALGREVRTESYGLNQKKIWVDTKYNAKGQVTSVSEPYFSSDTPTTWTTYSYDNYGRVKNIITPMGETEYKYEEKKTTVTTPSDKKETIINSAGFVVSETTNGKKVDFTYYASGLVKTATPESGQALSMEYDLQGNRTKLTDPDAGVITAKYDAWGQLTEEKQKIHVTADSIVTTYKYHASGLLDYKKRGSEKTKYEYDTKYHRLQSVSITGKHTQSYEYDDYDRITKTTDVVEDTKTFVRETEYDLFGRISRETYPSGYAITNKYDDYGYLTAVSDADHGTIWEAKDSNARGQLTKTQSGSIETNFGFDERGFPTSIVTQGVTDWQYSFNAKGNLENRHDKIADYKEVFTYDNLNRLTTYCIYNGAGGRELVSNQMNYDNNNNIERKSTFDTNDNFFMYYGENGNPPHALTSISPSAPELPDFMATDQEIDYTDFKKVKKIRDYDKGSLFIDYGTDEQRIKSVLTKIGTGTAPLTRYYMGNYEEKIQNGDTRKIHYISGGNGLAAVLIDDTLYFAHTDFQGSLIALSNEDGTVAQRYAYDPWGNRRNPDNWTQRDERTVFLLNRGYTLHEHLDDFALINMNGRVYDPLTAQFFSPDPYIQAPSDWLNYNRYAYAFGNPFKYIDPTGEWFGIDDLIVAAAGFVTGYVAHGLSTGNWGWKAVAAGGMGAGMAWLGYNTMGGSAAMSGWRFAGNQVVNTAVGMVVPPITFSIGDVNFSISPMAMFTAGAMSNANGFSLGLGISASYDIGYWTLSAGIGPGYKYAGFGYDDGKFGFSWHTTKYSGGIDGSSQGQRTATLGLRYKDWSISHENDVALMGGDGGDRFRSAALEIGYKDYVLGVNVYTNDPKPDGVVEGTNRYKNGIQYSSPLYIGTKIGYGMVKVGMEHPAIGNFFQNGFHRLIGSPLLTKSTVVPYTPYIKSGRYNPYSKYY